MSLETHTRRYASARDRAYAQLKRLFITCDLTPGSTWSEAELAARVQIGRTPLREAVQQLAQEELLTVLPRRGILISDVSYAQLQQMFELRMELERFCASLAAQRITPDEVAEGRRILGLPYTGDLDQHFGLDRQFHALVYRAARNTFLEGMLRRLYDSSVRVLYLSKAHQDSLDEVRGDHEALLAALDAHDAVTAVAISERHVSKFRDRVRAAL